MNRETESGQGTSEERGRGDRFSVVPLAVAVAAGIGTLGWVTFLGGALLWISFGEAQLPRAEAVGVVPTSVLIATGAEFATAAAAAVTVALVLLLLFDGFLRGLADQVRGERAEVKHGAREESEDRSRGGKNTVRERIREARPPRRKVEHDLIVGGLIAIPALLAALLIDLGHGAPPLLWPPGIPIVIIVSILAGWAGATLYRRLEIASMDEEERDGQGRRLYLFSMLGLVVFIAVPVVMGVGVYFRAQNAPRVEPMALLQSDGTPLAGFFVAETPDRVFVGTFERRVTETPCPEGAEGNTAPRNGADGPAPTGCVEIESFEEVAVPPRLLSLPREGIRNLSIGPRLPIKARDAKPTTTRGRPRSAREWAGSAALILCEEARGGAAGQSEQDPEEPTGPGAEGLEVQPDAAPEEPPSLGAEDADDPATTPGCSEQDVSDLEEFVAREQAVIESRAG